MNFIAESTLSLSDRIKTWSREIRWGRVQDESGDDDEIM